MVPLSTSQKPTRVRRVPTARSGCSSVTVKGRIYVLGGKCGASQVPHVDSFRWKAHSGASWAFGVGLNMVDHWCFSLVAREFPTWEEMNKARPKGGCDSFSHTRQVLVKYYNQINSNLKPPSIKHLLEETRWKASKSPNDQWRPSTFGFVFWGSNGRVQGVSERFHPTFGFLNAFGGQSSSKSDWTVQAFMSCCFENHFVCERPFQLTKGF